MKRKDAQGLKSVITSPQNSTIKLAKSLHMRKYREAYGMYFIEGIKMVKEALQERVSIEKLIFSEDFPISELGEECIAGIGSTYVTSGIFKQISDVENPQGVIAIIKKRRMTLQELITKPSYFIVILDRVQDPGNVGSIIRTVDAARGDAVVLLKGSADPYNPKTLRSTMGSIFRVPTFEIEESGSFIKQLISADTHLIVSCLNGDNLFNWNGNYNKTALVIGNESKGVENEIPNLASSRVTIPMAGRAESLNASVAAGILIYEIMAKAGKFKQEDY
jgi:TrmH family RNA methyltransferase